jgi:hypothetical protein
MVQAGVEPATLALLAPRSNQLSYKTFRTKFAEFLKKARNLPPKVGSSIPSVNYEFGFPANLFNRALHALVSFLNGAGDRVGHVEKLFQAFVVIGIVDLLVEDDLVVGVCSD